MNHSNWLNRIVWIARLEPLVESSGLKIIPNGHLWCACCRGTIKTSIWALWNTCLNCSGYTNLLNCWVTAPPDAMVAELEKWSALPSSTIAPFRVGVLVSSLKTVFHCTTLCFVNVPATYHTRTSRRTCFQWPKADPPATLNSPCRGC